MWDSGCFYLLQAQSRSASESDFHRSKSFQVLCPYAQCFTSGCIEESLRPDALWLLQSSHPCLHLQKFLCRSQEDLNHWRILSQWSWCHAQLCLKVLRAIRQRKSQSFLCRLDELYFVEFSFLPCNQCNQPWNISRQLSATLSCHRLGRLLR